MNDSFAKVCGDTRVRRPNGRSGSTWPAAVCGLGLWLAAGAAWGANSCTVTSTAIVFGSYDPLSAVALPGTGTLTFNCSSGLLFSFVISLNTGSSGSYAPRTMKNGALSLGYNLYTSAAHTTVWGDTTAGTATVTAGPYLWFQLPQSVTVYGLIPALQNAVAGAYTDSITATVTF